MVTPKAIAEGKATSMAARPPQMSPARFLRDVAVLLVEGIVAESIATPNKPACEYGLGVQLRQTADDISLTWIRNRRDDDVSKAFPLRWGAVPWRLSLRWTVSVK